MAGHETESVAVPEPHCPDCGSREVASLEACQELFTQAGAREFADPAYFPAHRLTVDAYCLQHPDVYMKSSKSAAAHLALMCWSMEYGESRNAPHVLKQWLDGPRTYPRVTPPPPLQRGTLTVRHVLAAEDAEEYLTRAREWATSAWHAWREHWDQARTWVNEALAEHR